MAKRLQRMPQSAHKYRHGFRPTFHPDEIRKFRDRAAGWRKPRRVFVGSMGDIMDPGFDDEQIREVIRVAVAFPRHTFMFLSKRPWRYADFIWPRNAWLGATACDAETLARASHLDVVPAAVRFLSMEPLLESLRVWTGARLHWIILGAQTGPGAQPPKRAWVDALTTQARQRGWAVFWKDNLPWAGPQEFPDEQHALPLP